MTTTRKSFLAAAASSALIAAAPSPSPQSAASPSPPPKLSPQARSLAAMMRQFDPNLGDKALETIAGGIDGNLKLGNSVNPKGRALKNWNEPDFVFEAAE